MLERAKEIIEDIAKETDSILLFHSLSGKDSIALLDLCYPRFKRVVCVYMYVVPNLDHIKPYYVWAKRKYPNAEFIQVPHYGVYSYIKYGYLGCKVNPNQHLYTLSDIIDKVRGKTGVEWVCLGFKQSDSLNRMLMLRSYKDGKMGISWKGKKFYPLSTYKNKDVLNYIAEQHLKNPEAYEGGSGQSCGCAISSYPYLKYLERNYPQDLDRIYAQYPAAQIIITNYEAEQDRDNQAEPDTSESVQP